MTSEPSKVFISHRNCEPDKTLANQISEALTQEGHQPFLDFSNIQFGEKWPERIDQELKCCDCLLLLLSRQAITSDWVTQEVETIWKRRRQSASQDYPMILPVLIQPASDSMFSLEDAPYELRSYLSKVQYRVWRSPEDTPEILSQVLAALSHEQSFPQREQDSISNGDLQQPAARPKSTSLQKLNEKKIQNLEKRLKALEENWDALSEQLNYTTNAANRKDLERQITSVESEITKVAEELDSLKE